MALRLPSKRKRMAAPAIAPMATPAHIPASAKGTAPPGGAGSGFGKFFHIFQEPRVNNRRLLMFVGVLVSVVVAQSASIVALSQSAGKVPYFIEHDPQSGAVWISDRAAIRFTPQASNKTYFLRIWATRFQTIKPDVTATLNVDHPAAFGWTIGSAKNEFTEYFDKEDKVVDIAAKDPGTTREIVENGTSYSADGNTAFMVITRIWRINGVETHRDQKLLTMTFIFAPETLNEGEEKDNPLGLRISHFVVAPYYGPTAGAQQ
jgi:type IV secretion system protein TrbF